MQRKNDNANGPSSHYDKFKIFLINYWFLEFLWLLFAVVWRNLPIKKQYKRMGQVSK